MKTDKEIYETLRGHINMYNTSFPYVSTENQKIIIELLLDIRNILTKKEKEEE